MVLYCHIGDFATKQVIVIPVDSFHFRMVIVCTSPPEEITAIDQINMDPDTPVIAGRESKKVKLEEGATSPRTPFLTNLTLSLLSHSDVPPSDHTHTQPRLTKSRKGVLLVQMRPLQESTLVRWVSRRNKLYAIEGDPFPHERDHALALLAHFFCERGRSLCL